MSATRATKAVKAVAARAWAAPLLVLLAATRAAALDDPLAVELPEVPVMPGMETRWIGERMAWNGLPLSARLFRTPEAPQAVLAWYERAWSRRGRGEVVRDRQGPWRVIGYRDGEHWLTVRVRAARGGGSEGVLAASLRPDRVRPRREAGLPLPPGVRVLHVLESLDGTRRARSVTLRSPYAPEATLARIRSRLGEAGWRAVPDSLAQARGGVQQSFQRDAALCQVSVTADGRGSLALVHVVR